MIKYSIDSIVNSFKHNEVKLLIHRWLSKLSYRYFTALNLVDLNVLIVHVLTMIVFIHHDNLHNDIYDDDFA